MEASPNDLYWSCGLPFNITLTTIHEKFPGEKHARKNSTLKKLLHFVIEWSSYIEQFVEVRELLIIGDFNIHIDSSNNGSQSFLDILS